jgi:hypothetical protein
MRPPESSRTRDWLIAPVLFLVWAVLVAIALVATLSSLQEADFDGLNNLLQIPLALPWSLLPVPGLTGWSHEADAWFLAAMGWVNGTILAVWVDRRVRAR